MAHPPQIPLTPQTNEANFPRWASDAPPGQSGSAFPKMLLRPFTKEDREVWRERNRKIDQNTRQEFYEERCPKVGDMVPVLATEEVVDAGFAARIGEELIARDAGQMQALLLVLKNEAWLQGRPEPVLEKPRTVEIPLAQSTEDAISALEAENDALRKRIAQEQKPRRKRRYRRKQARAHLLSPEEFAGE